MTQIKFRLLRPAPLKVFQVAGYRQQHNGVSSIGKKKNPELPLGCNCNELVESSATRCRRQITPAMMHRFIADAEVEGFIKTADANYGVKDPGNGSCLTEYGAYQVQAEKPDQTPVNCPDYQ
jgi:hypothetical protein